MNNPRHNWARYTDGKYVITAYQAHFDFYWSDETGNTFPIKAGDYLIEEIGILGGRTCIDKTKFEAEYKLLNQEQEVRFPRRID